MIQRSSTCVTKCVTKYVTKRHILHCDRHLPPCNHYSADRWECHNSGGTVVQRSGARVTKCVKRWRTPQQRRASTSRGARPVLLPAVCCDMLQCVALCCTGKGARLVLQCVAVCCSVLQCVSRALVCFLCFCLLQCADPCIFACYSMLIQRVAVCCSVLQRVIMWRPSSTMQVGIFLFSFLC